MGCLGQKGGEILMGLLGCWMVVPLNIVYFRKLEKNTSTALAVLVHLRRPWKTLAHSSPQMDAASSGRRFLLDPYIILARICRDVFLQDCREVGLKGVGSVSWLIDRPWLTWALNVVLSPLRSLPLEISSLHTGGTISEIILLVLFFLVNISKWKKKATSHFPLIHSINLFHILFY